MATEGPGRAKARWGSQARREAVPRGAAPVALAHVAAAVASIAAVVILTRLLAAEGYGLYAALIGLVTIVQNAGYLALQSSLIRFHAQAGDADAQLRLATAVRMAFVLASLVVAVVWLLAVHWLGAAGITAELAIAGLVLLLARGWLSLVQGWNRVKARYWTYFALEAVQAFGAVGLAVLALEIVPGEPAAAVWAAAGAATVAAACAPTLVLTPLHTHGSRRLLADMFSYSAPFALVFLATAMLALSDRLIVAVYAGPAAAGAYAVAFAIADRALYLVMLPVPVATKAALFAAWEVGGDAAARPIMERSARWLIVIGLPVATILIAAPEFVAGVLVGEDIAGEAARVIPWLAVGSLLSALLLLHFSLAFQLSRRTLRMLAAVGVPAALNIVANLALVPRYGMIAAGWTTVGSYSLAVAVALLLGRREVQVPFPPGLTLKTAALCIPLGTLIVAVAG